ncbi:hypothetical protein DL96DRAFT_1720677 [Flagelloscypha sp. PMI_526]|nr:hypothetical protein DL96DRAFT_1720677 [Flagelloscypha sp. PMI_526]
MPKPLKPALRRAPLMPFSLEVRVDKYEKEDDKDEEKENKRGTAIIDTVLSLGAATPLDACTGESTCKPQPPTSHGTSSPIGSSPAPLSAYLLSSFQAKNQMCMCPPSAPSSLQATLDALQTQLQASATYCSKSASASASPQQAPLPPPLALASSGAAETGSLPVTKLYIPPPVPRVNSPRLPKRVPPTWPLSSPPRSNIQAPSIGQEESVIEKDSRPLIRRDMLPPWNTAATTGTCSKDWCGRIWREIVDQLAGPPTIVSRTSRRFYEVTHKTRALETLCNSLSSICCRSSHFLVYHAFSLYIQPASTTRYRPRDSIALIRMYRVLTTDMMDVGIVKQKPVVVSVTRRMNIGLTATIRTSPHHLLILKQEVLLRPLFQVPGHLDFRNSQDPPFAKSPASRWMADLL